MKKSIEESNNHIRNHEDVRNKTFSELEQYAKTLKKIHENRHDVNFKIQQKKTKWYNKEIIQ